MTTKENAVKVAKLDVSRAAVKVVETKLKFLEGQKVAHAKVAQARAEAEQELAELAANCERATIEQQKEQSFLELAEADLARGFET